MAETRVIKQDPSEWIASEEQVNEEEDPGAENQQVYIAMQPGEMGQLQEVEVQDCQEVVIMGDGGEVVQDIGDTIELGETQIVPVGAEEVYGEAFVSVPKDEKADIKEALKASKSRDRYSLPSKLQMQLDAASTPRSSLDNFDFSRPSFVSPQKYYKTSYYRPGGGKSLAKMRRIENRGDSDTESESDAFMPDRSYLPHKTPKRREFAHR